MSVYWATVEILKIRLVSACLSYRLFEMFCENIDIVRSGPSMVVANSDILPECVFETNIYLGGERKHILVR